MEHKLIFKALVGSQAQGTSTPESDRDIKGIYMQDVNDLISFGYEEFVEVTKDESYYEIKRFIELLMVANPNAIEILFSPDDCVLETSPQFKLLYDNRHRFLTKKCYGSFAGYANMQINKAKGLDKKMNWEKDRFERKTPLDFCYVHMNGKTKPLTTFLKENELEQERCGLVKLNHFDNGYAIYYDLLQNQNFKGIVGENSNELRLSSVSKEYHDLFVNKFKLHPEVLYYNKDGYTTHCKDYKSYQTWLKERNTNRYHTNKSHGQVYDSKNLSHCRRLIDIAKEIGETGTFTVRRPNAEYLMSIKRGDMPLDQIIADAEKDIKGLKDIYDNSNLPDDVDKEFVKELLLSIRMYTPQKKRIGVVCNNVDDFNNWKFKQGHRPLSSRKNKYMWLGNEYYCISDVCGTCGLTLHEIIYLTEDNLTPEFKSALMTSLINEE